MKTKLLTLILGIFLFTSCSKKDDNTVTPQTTNNSKVVVSDTTYSFFIGVYDTIIVTINGVNYLESPSDTNHDFTNLPAHQKIILTPYRKCMFNLVWEGTVYYDNQNIVCSTGGIQDSVISQVTIITLPAGKLL